MSTSRAEVLSQLAFAILAVKCPHPVRVAIDGVDGAGKTILADELAPFIKKHDRPVIRSSVDGFHNPRTVRHQLGPESPEGYYRDSFNYELLQRVLLIPLGPGGDRRYRPMAFNLKEDRPTDETWCEAPSNTILLFDGVFLLRSELIQYWDFSIFVEVIFDISVPRAILRDLSGTGQKWDADLCRVYYERRYVPGQQLYFQEVRPKERASIIVDNNDYQNPIIIKN